MVSMRDFLLDLQSLFFHNYSKQTDPNLLSNVNSWSLKHLNFLTNRKKCSDTQQRRSQIQYNHVKLQKNLICKQMTCYLLKWCLTIGYTLTVVYRPKHYFRKSMTLNLAKNISTLTVSFRCYSIIYMISTVKYTFWAALKHYVVF